MKTSIGVSFVNVYELWQHYGGPEEGGWWFTSGDLVRTLAVPSIEANDYAALMEVLYPRGSASGECYWSVVYPGGDHRVYIEDEAGEPWPEEWPHYE